jgi:ACS family pantothenate transporter-like MFS transporter
MNAFGNATTTIIQQFAYPVLDAPEYKFGFRTSLGLICGMVGWVFVVRYFEMRVQNAKSETARQVIEGVVPDRSINIQPEKVC